MGDFRKLEVYNKTLGFIEKIYNITKAFPKEEQFSLVNQFKRAATSVAFNIAEGSGRNYSKDQIQFLRIALGSSLECQALLDISLKLSYIDKQEYSDLCYSCSEISKMLHGLLTSFNSKLSTNDCFKGPIV